MYLEQGITFKMNVKVTPFMIATNNIPSEGWRIVTPQHILYMAMEILRQRDSEGLYSTFRYVGETNHIARSMIEDKEYVETCTD
jgi:hypothetical protein